MSGHNVLSCQCTHNCFKKIFMYEVGLICVWLAIQSLPPRCSPMFPLHPGLHTLAWRCWSSLAAHYFSSRHPVGCPHWRWWVLAAPGHWERCCGPTASRGWCVERAITLTQKDTHKQMYKHTWVCQMLSLTLCHYSICYRPLLAELWRP